MVQTLEVCLEVDGLPLLVELIHGELELVDVAAVNDKRVLDRNSLFNWSKPG